MLKNHGVWQTTCINGVTCQIVTLLLLVRNRYWRAQTGPKTGSIAESAPIPEAGNGSQILSSVEDNLSMSEPYGRRHLPRRHRAAPHGWAHAPQYSTSSTPATDNIFECGPKSRGFPYASMARVAMPSAPISPHSTTARTQSVDRYDNIWHSRTGRSWHGRRSSLSGEGTCCLMLPTVVTSIVIEQRPCPAWLYWFLTKL